MSQWTKEKIKQRGPPPALFSHLSPAASNISLAGGDNATGSRHLGNGQTANAGGGAGLGLNANSAKVSGRASAASSMPSLPTLHRTTSRIRQDASNGLGGGGSSAGGGPLSLSPQPSTAHSQIAGQSDPLQVGGSSGKGGGSPVTAAGKASAATAGTVQNSTPSTTAFTLPLPPRHVSSTRAADRTDALWAEMQATLEEVELSASEGTRVFGPDHDQKLAVLRQAQIALAQAWARSEADEANEISGESGGLSGTAEGGVSVHSLLKPSMAAGASVAGAGGAGKDDGSSNNGPSKERAGSGLDSRAASHTRDNVDRFAGRPLEEETQVDILLARRRREANDRYFQRVNRGVLDVVAKLEDVADAMRAVEQESMDLLGNDAVGEQPARMSM
ncbi:hypothetical protein SEPCBS119000_002994 [Sporothrix epigloea]|uniref:Uncharacterized protein n=1 Tax=Sporothrix epigloea TaxID=1892477 RepID=A0ABP0DL09_9PEZI